MSFFDLFNQFLTAFAGKQNLNLTLGDAWGLDRDLMAKDIDKKFKKHLKKIKKEVVKND